jgi:hypothetical protein
MFQCKNVRSVKLRLNYKVKMIYFNKSMHRQLKKQQESITWYLRSSTTACLHFGAKFHCTTCLLYIYIILPQHLNFHYFSLFMTKIHTTMVSWKIFSLHHFDLHIIIRWPENVKRVNKICIHCGHFIHCYILLNSVSFF